MTEKLRINCTFGNRSTVHCNIFGMLAHTVLMYYLREELLTHTALPGDKNRKVGLCNLDSSINRSQQFRVISDNSELLLGILDFRYIHCNLFCDKITYFTAKTSNFGRKSSAKSSLKREEQRKDKYHHDSKDYLQRQTYLDIIGELILSCRHHKCIGRRRER